ncbi:Endoglucanase E-4 precursor [Minicystis rosea]|nr:Endoglucanase E-4 precursor [Minicystis rosea]
MTKDPERLADGGGSEALRELCAAAERDVLDDQAVGRVRAGLAAQGQGNPGDPTATGAAPKGLGSIVKLVALSALIGGALGVSILSSRSGAPAPPAAPSPSASASVESSAAPPSSPPPVPAPEPSAQPAPTASTQRPTRATPKPLASAPATPLPSTSAAAPTPREGLLLLRARQALDADPARALSLVEQHEREFPNSQLAPERSALRRQAEAHLRR